MSSEIYELMKRSDEGAVVEKAHRRPRFVEDCVREMIRGVLERFPDLADAAFVSARQENLETIHQHNVVAERFGLLGRAAPRAAHGRAARAPHVRCATGSTAAPERQRGRRGVKSFFATGVAKKDLTAIFRARAAVSRDGAPVRRHAAPGGHDDRGVRRSPGPGFWPRTRKPGQRGDGRLERHEHAEHPGRDAAQRLELERVGDRRRRATATTTAWPSRAGSKRSLPP